MAKTACPDKKARAKIDFKTVAKTIFGRTQNENSVEFNILSLDSVVGLSY